MATQRRTRGLALNALLVDVARPPVRVQPVTD